MSGVVLAAGLLAVLGAVGLLLGVVLRPPRVALERRTLPGTVTRSALTSTTDSLVASLDRALHGRGLAERVADALAQAGLALRPGQLAVLVGSGALVGAALGLLLSGVVLGLVLFLLAPLLAKVVLGFKADRRRAAFADQLDGALQMIASSLRAGHSLLRALDAVARELPAPTSEEFSRVLNETRVGRALGESLEETAVRTRSEDFRWVAQAIAIQREVGGDLAGVLDGVAHTIRERNQIRRQVKALSAEGKLSAYVLMALPIGITGFLSFSNPTYMAKFGNSVIGMIMVGVALVLLAVGALWLRATVKIKF